MSSGRDPDRPGRMDYARGNFRHAGIEKHKVPVRVELANGTVQHGFVFLRHDQRVIDLLCDARPFFPVESRTGLSLVAKGAVARVVLLTREQIEAEADQFPDIDWKALASKTW